MGRKQNLTSEDLSYFSLNDLKREVNNKKLTRQKNEYNSSKLIFLPQVIENSGDIDVVRLPLGQPTFITQEKLISRIIKLNDMRKDLKKIRDKIVCIKNADPGYDWLFSQNIRGLVTAYGGSNSHMAIRCAELSIPAAIGCGERFFKQIISDDVLYLNCSEKIIKNREINDYLANWLIGFREDNNRNFSIQKIKNRSVVFIDGDDIRKLWNDNLGYTLKEREKNASRVSNFCKFLDSQGIDVVASILSNFPKWQKWNRENFSHYFQVYLDVPINILKKGTQREYILIIIKILLALILNLILPTSRTYILNIIQKIQL